MVNTTSVIVSTCHIPDTEKGESPMEILHTMHSWSSTICPYMSTIVDNDIIMGACFVRIS